MSQASPRQYVRENKEMISRVLASGDTEAQSYALALLAKDPDPEAIEQVQKKLDELKRQASR